MPATNSRDAKELLPLTHLTFHILLALKEGPLHGYAIDQLIDARSHGTVQPGTGTFYSALRRMLDDGVIVEGDAPAQAESADSRRRYYGLTDFGEEVAAAETGRLKDLVNWAESTVR